MRPSRLVSVVCATLVVMTGCAPTEDEPAGAPAAVAANALPINRVWEVALAPDESLWAATEGGVVRWDLGVEPPMATVHLEEDGLPGRGAAAITVAPDGTVWVADSGWIASYDGATWNVVPSEQVPGLEGDLGDLAVGPDGTVCVAGSDDLLRYDDGTWEKVQSPESLASPWTGSLAVAPDGTVWATPNGEMAVVSYDGDRWRRYDRTDGIPGHTSTVAVAPDGTIWVGGTGGYGDPSGDVPAGGVTTYDGTTWTTYTTDDGLPSNDAGAVVGGDGTVWAVSAEGVARFDGSSWSSFSAVAGTARGAAVDADGVLWLPTSRGVVGFDGTESTTLAVDPAVLPLATRLPALDLLASDLLASETEATTRIETALGDVTFTTYRFPPGQGFVHPAPTAFGVVAHDEDVLHWSQDLLRWERISVGFWIDGVQVSGDDLLVFGDELARFGWDGTGWTELARFELPGDVSELVVGDRGMVAVEETTILFSTDGQGFTGASQPPTQGGLPAGGSGGCQTQGGTGYTVAQLGPLLATDDGFVVLTPAAADDWTEQPWCEPLLWRSGDGDVWELVSDDSPFGAGAAVAAVAADDERFVAIGSVPAEDDPLTRDREGAPDDGGAAGVVWVSEDGLSWERVDLAIDYAATVDAGEFGWVITGDVGGDFIEQELWVSADGEDWDGPHPLPDALRTGYIAPNIAVGADVIFGVGFRDPTDAPVIGRIDR
jgi:hypothetical protein